MKDRRIHLPSLKGAYRRVTAPWKARLDRRYLTHAESAVMLSTLHDNLSRLRSDSRDRESMLASTDRRLAEGLVALADLSERLSTLETELRERIVALETELTGRVVDLDADVEQLKVKSIEIRDEAAKGSAFVAHEEPHALRKKLFESHRLAREGAEAIESLLQAELLLWQATDAISTTPPDSESVSG